MLLYITSIEIFENIKTCLSRVELINKRREMQLASRLTLLYNKKQRTNSTESRVNISEVSNCKIVHGYFNDLKRIKKACNASNRLCIRNLSMQNTSRSLY